MRFLAMTLAALAPCLSLAQTPEQLTGDFLERENRFARAYQAKDIKLLEQLLAPEYALTVSARPDKPLPRADWLALIPQYNVRSFEIRGVQVRCLREAMPGQCELAAVSSINTQQADVGGQDRSGEFFIVDIWSYRDGRWMVSARYSGRTEAAVPALMERQGAADAAVQAPLPVPAADLKWIDLDPSGAPGVKIAHLWGDHRSGPFGAFFRLPGGFSAPLHAHTHEMKLVIVSGTYIQGPEGQPEFRLGPGSYLMQPGGRYWHTTRCDQAAECLFFVESDGAFDLQPAAASDAAKAVNEGERS